MSKKKATPDNNLQSVNPELAKEWHPTKNGSLKPTEVLPYSQKKVWWSCVKGHEWSAEIGSRSQGYKCPYCWGRFATPENNLAIIHPEVATEWHPMKNGTLRPIDVTPLSSKRVWWKCTNGHERCSTVKSRVRANGCPCKKGRLFSQEHSLAALFPKVAKQWHPTKNGRLAPCDVGPRSNKIVWWICEQGHEWKTFVYTRTDGWGCRICSGRVATSEHNLEIAFSDIALQWCLVKNGSLKPCDVTPHSGTKVWWKCINGHEWEAAICNRTSTNKTGCPYCSTRVSKGCVKWLDSIGLPNDSQHREVILKAGKHWYCVDGFDKDINTVYEYLGDFWHGNPNRFKPTGVNPQCKETYGSLLLGTVDKLNNIYNGGFKIIYKWESAANHQVYKPGVISASAH